MTWAKVSK